MLRANSERWYNGAGPGAYSEHIDCPASEKDWLICLFFLNAPPKLNDTDLARVSTMSRKKWTAGKNRLHYLAATLRGLFMIR